MKLQSKLTCTIDDNFSTFTFENNCYWHLKLQSRFLLSGLHADGQWIVPITLCIGSYERQTKFLLDKSDGRVDISELVQHNGDDVNSNENKHEEVSQENLWIKVNVDQSGFYRVNYEDKLAVRLRKAVQNNYLLPTDKFGVCKFIVT
jgi:puromycin-sensitive aminopeptidase